MLQKLRFLVVLKTRAKNYKMLGKCRILNDCKLAARSFFPYVEPTLLLGQTCKLLTV